MSLFINKTRISIFKRVMRTDILEKKSLIEQLIRDGVSKAFICRQLQCKPATLQAYLQKMGISYSGNKSSLGIKDKGYKPASFYLESETFIGSHRLKQKLIKDCVKEEKCEICGIVEWNGQPAPLELDHIDGNHFNNSLLNLRIVCPNCHAQQDTNSGKNKGKYK